MEQVKDGQWRSTVREAVIAIALLVACLGLNVYECLQLRLQHNVPMWVEQAIPVALSNLEFDHPSDYTGLTGVNHHFYHIAKEPSARTVNRAIRYTLWHKHKPLDRRPYLASVDDKGIVDFVKLAFVLFGYRVEHVTYLYGIFLAATATLFLARFFRQRWAMTLLYTFLLAHACALAPISINPQLSSVLALRFLSVLGMVATLHLVLEVWSAERRGWLALLGIGGQALFLLFVLHLRFSAMWELLCVFGAFGILLVRRGWAGLAPRRRGEIVPALLAVGLLLAGWASLGIYKRTVYAPDYFTKGGPSHFFWHSVYTGLAYSPELAREKGIRIDDLSVYDGTERFLKENGRLEQWEALQGSQDLYDRAVRDMFIHTCRERPGAVLLSLVYHKPLALAQYVAWHFRLVADAPRQDILWENAEKEMPWMSAEMDRTGKSFRLLRLECLLPLGFLAFWARRSLREHSRKLAGICALFFACSLMPGLGGYPTAHTIWDALIVVGMLFYLGLVAGLAAAMMGLSQRRERPSAKAGELPMLSESGSA